jgi:antitoxin (DNA-binding transcriptional repressor) of toxin-antitoxin stability system
MSSRSFIPPCPTVTIGDMQKRLKLKPNWSDLAGDTERAEGGEDIILTRRGHAIARLVALARDAAARRAALEDARGTAQASAGPNAARSQDFLYDETGLPG